MAVIQHSSLFTIRFRRSWDLAVQPEEFDFTVKDGSNDLSPSDSGNYSLFIYLWLALGTISICLLTLICIGFIYIWKALDLSRFLSPCNCLGQVCLIVLHPVRSLRHLRVVAETTDTNNLAYMMNSPERSSSAASAARSNCSESIV